MSTSGGRRLPWEIDNAESSKSTAKTKTRAPRSRRQKNAADATPPRKQKRQMAASSSDDESQEQHLDQDQSVAAHRDIRDSNDIKNASYGNDIDNSAIAQSSEYEEENLLDTDSACWMEMERGDEKYRMVEDEFFDVAREYAASLHAAELADLKSQASRPASSHQPYETPFTPSSKSTLLLPSDFGADKASKLALLMTSPIKQPADLDANLKSPTTIRRRPATYQSNSTSDAMKKQDEEEGDIIDQLLRDSSALPITRKNSHERIYSGGRRLSSTLNGKSVKMRSSMLERPFPQIIEDFQMTLPEMPKTNVKQESTISERSGLLPMGTTTKEERKESSEKGITLSERVALRRANMLRGSEEPDFITEFLQSEPVCSTRRNASRTKT
ncbi:uncharacterized protein V1513DRAFT_310804 [Lipomyces chichibuensis]|uniref:uncharacterized protein n=1 Tax=Lipomyces chichibuensis TaxID=1546026 RepID=UPI003342E840